MAHRSVLVILVAYLFGCIASEYVPPQDPRDPEYSCFGCTDLQKMMLDLHNQYRRLENAANMNELHWSRDDELAARAQANLCRVPSWGEEVHGNTEPDYGQNVASLDIPGDISDQQILDMIHGWYNEKFNYDYPSNGCQSGSECEDYKVMVSAYIRNVGCSFAKCRRNKNGEQKQFWNFVCNYSIWPNSKSGLSHPEQPFISGQSCSQCHPGLICRNRLCA